MSVKYFYSWLAILSLIAGLILISIQKNLIILNFKKNHLRCDYLENQPNCLKKNISLYFWQNEKLKNERVEILWEQDLAKNLTNLIQSWLVLITEKQISKNKINLQAVLISKNEQIAYLSFDKTLFNKNSSCYQKLILLESLLKTIREAQTKIQYVQFLVQHQIMQDPHLDFANPWPISGFLKN